MSVTLVSRIPAPVAALVLVGAMAMAAAPDPIPSPIPATVSAPQGVLPSVVYQAGQQAVDAYKAALQSPGVLQAVPCTCGCAEAMGHENSYDCYIKEIHANGSVTYTTHGLYCTVCQFITRDAVAGTAVGLSGNDLYAMILDRYGPRR